MYTFLHFLTKFRIFPQIRPAASQIPAFSPKAFHCHVCILVGICVLSFLPSPRSLFHICWIPCRLPPIFRELDPLQTLAQPEHLCHHLAAMKLVIATALPVCACGVLCMSRIFRVRAPMQDSSSIAENLGRQSSIHYQRRSSTNHCQKH